MAEIVPAVIRRLRALARARVGVCTIAVEVHAVRSGVRIHAVEHYAYPHAARRHAQMREVLIRAEDRIDLQIIRAVVAVVGARLNDGVEVQAGHAELFQVRQFALDAAQRAAVEIVRRIRGLKFARPVAYRLVKTLVQLRSLAKAFVILYAAARGVVIRERKAVGEYLIHHAAAEPGRSLKVAAEHRQAEAAAALGIEPAVISAPVRTKPALALVCVEMEAVPECGGALRRDVRGVQLSGTFHRVFKIQIVAVQNECGTVYFSGR